MDQLVALTIEGPPLVGKGPRLNSASMGGTPDSPKVPFRNVDVWIPPQVHFEGSLPSIFSSSATPCSNDLRTMASRVSLMLGVVVSSHQGLVASRWRMISFQREPPS